MWTLNLKTTCNFLIIKPTRCTNFSNLFLEWNSACFGQFLCPSSGVFHCTHSNGVCHTGFLTACSQAVSKPVWYLDGNNVLILQSICHIFQYNICIILILSYLELNWSNSWGPYSLYCQSLKISKIRLNYEMHATYSLPYQSWKFGLVLLVAFYWPLIT